jgi:hypothetical protein
MECIGSTVDGEYGTFRVMECIIKSTVDGEYNTLWIE